MATNASWSCVCEPSNVALYCSREACACLPGASGNRVVELVIRDDPLPGASNPATSATAPTLTARVSHIAGRIWTGMCDCSFNGAVVCLTCGTFVVPLLMALWTCLVVETHLTFHRHGSSVRGTVTRRSTCCTWRTVVAGVSKIETEGLSSDAESLPHVYLHHGTGDGKIDIGEGIMEGLEGPVNAWLQPDPAAMSSVARAKADVPTA
jgi:hypothetical protein